MTLTMDQWRKAADMATKPKTDPIADANRRAAGLEGRARPTPEQTNARRGEAARQAWEAARARVEGWPEELAARELQHVQDVYGAEPGGASPAERLARNVTFVEDPEPAAASVDRATARLAGLLGVQLDDA